MIIRNYQKDDLNRLQELHKDCGFDYPFPDVDAAPMLVKRVLCEGGNIQMAALLRMTTEAYLLVDSSWRGPAWRWEALKKMQSDVNAQARREGITDCSCWMPPELEKRFGKRLKQLGWQASGWPTYTAFVSD